MTDGHHFNNISLGGRGGNNPGQFKLYSGGLAWKRQGGGKTIEVDKSDITSVTWMSIPRSYQLSVSTKEGLFYRFFGFREQDISSLINFIEKNMGIIPDEKQLSVSGHNCGGIEINGNMLSFNVGPKEAFEVSLADVAQTQMQGKTDVVLEFHVDDTTGAHEKDSLMDLSFHVPTSNTQFPGDENRPSAQILWQAILSKADVGSSEEAVVTFDGIAVLTPRGRYSVELHLSFLRLQGQASDFKIQYSSILRLFVLPKSNNPHTFVVITLDPPIRKGQTLYPHIVIQFETEAVVQRDLTLSEEVLAEKYKDRLESSYQGLIHEVFSKVLRGLSGAKVTRPSTFRSCQDGYAVKSSLKAEDGLLYPLEKGFFFLPKPPTLILHEEIEYVEFERHGAGGASMSSHYFDLLVKLKNDQEHLFRNIQRNEYHNLFNFISGKHLKILNLGDGQGRAGGVTAVLQSTDDVAVDPHLERIRNQTGDDESDEEDEDFVADKDDSGSPTDDSGEDGSDASLSGGEKEKSSKKEASISKAPLKKRKPKSGDAEGSEKRKPKKKKDPNAPKRAIAPFMYFSKAERANLKNSNPELATTEIAKKLGERWQKMTAEEKQPYIEQSQVDKKRYAEESAAYRGAAAMDVDPGPASPSASASD
ncbi:FACT complex subunit SSRP1-B [Oryza brachyantha]|uniref:FACT complex subunit SSRP1 n=1 Tax=Oryza brachyantha TaxID=4533 RepID=J3M4J9_ORYBR|nr:FACT complex subunit SSRP1-B [Oryza brachyantha]